MFDIIKLNLKEKKKRYNKKNYKTNKKFNKLVFFMKKVMAIIYLKYYFYTNHKP